MALPLDRLIFFPDRRVPPPPQGVRERWLTAADGTRLNAWHAANAARAPHLVWSHGNGGNVADRAELIVALQRRGLDVLAYDYRGYGKSEGRPSETGVALDAEAAYDAVAASGVGAEKIVAFGESLGGAVSIRLASRRRCAAIAVVSTFTRLQDVARRHYGMLAVVTGDRFDSLSLVRRLRVPILVAHGDQDEIVPYALGAELFAAANQPKRFFRAAGFHHDDVFDAPGLVEAVAGFALEVAGG